MALKNNNKNCCIKKIGPKGDKGDKGPKGPRGLKGDKGDKGKIGPTGDIGDVGEKGDRGEKGARGFTGDPGPIGREGDRGPTGAAGETGDAGDKGPKGDKGADGQRGDIGPKGDRGDKGETGDVGPKGITGQVGVPGLNGPQGDRGPKGDTGPQGDRGFNGGEGPKGDKGPRGDIGPKGQSGRPGERGNPGQMGSAGDISYEIPMPGEIIIKKVLKHIINRGLRCNVSIDSSGIYNFNGVGDLNNEEEIVAMVNNCIHFSNNVIVPISNIVSVNVSYRDEGVRNNGLAQVIGIFNSVSNCEKNSPSIVNIVNGDIQDMGDLSYDYEYVVNCTCNDQGNCICIGEKIDLCKYSSYGGSYLRNRLGEKRLNMKTISKIITSNGEELSTLKGVVGPINIEVGCVSCNLITYTIGVDRPSFSVVNLDKVSSIVYN